jgi:hypothetical protein
MAMDWTCATEEELRQGYEQMAGDEEHEREALEWAEAMIGEGLDGHDV